MSNVAGMRDVLRWEEVQVQAQDLPGGLEHSGCRSNRMDSTYQQQTAE